MTERCYDFHTDGLAASPLLTSRFSDSIDSIDYVQSFSLSHILQYYTNFLGMEIMDSWAGVPGLPCLY
jgi:hypothetical protein